MMSHALRVLGTTMRPQKHAIKLAAVHIAEVAVNHKYMPHATAPTTAAHTVSPCSREKRRQTAKSTAVRLAPYHHRVISSVIHL